MLQRLNDNPASMAVEPDGPAVNACAHCGLDVPAGLIELGEARQFCCHGCRTAWQVIHACGLDRFYALRAGTDGPGNAAQGRADTHEEFDHAAFHSLYTRNLVGGLARTELYVEGVHCAACVWLLERLPSVVEGIAEARLDLRKRLLTVVWQPEAVRFSEIARFVESVGYRVHPARDAQSRAQRQREDREFLIRIGVSGAIAGNVMLLAFALYGGMFSEMAAPYAAMFRWVSMGLAIASLVWPGRVFFRGAIAGLRMGTLHMDLPIAIGLGAGAAWGAVNTVRGTGEVYFDTVTMLVFLLLVGRWLQHGQQRRASDAVELLFSLAPSVANLVRGDEVKRVPTSSLMAGDEVRVDAGDSIPVDGRVIRGATTIDASILTGESRPVDVCIGDDVAAGAVNLSSPVHVVVTATGEATRIGRLLQMVDEGARRKAPIVKMADRLAGRFVAVVLGLAGLTFGLWLYIEPARAFDQAAALLIVTCPCALGLATPLAVVSAIGKAARTGLLIKGGDVIERLSTVGTLVLDKTGTLTEGVMNVVEWRGDERALQMAAALERSCTHPLARALVKAFGDHSGADANSVQYEHGGGVAGEVSGACVLVGSEAYLGHRGVSVPDELAVWLAEMVSRGLTPVLVAVDGVCRAIAGIGDRVRLEGAEVVRSLRALGWEVRLLSGDHPAVVRSVAAQVGIESAHAQGGATPEMKLEEIDRLHRAGTVVMVGDGVNDAAALACASVGVAVHGGAEASLSAADVFLTTGGLRPLVELVQGATRTVGVIRRNLMVSLGYNAACASLAIAGLINPLLAAILMPASSVTVIVLSYRSRTFGGGR